MHTVHNTAYCDQCCYSVVCQLHGCAVQRWLNRSSCCSQWRFLGTYATLYQMRDLIPYSDAKILLFVDYRNIGHNACGSCQITLAFLSWCCLEVFCSLLVIGRLVCPMFECTQSEVQRACCIHWTARRSVLRCLPSEFRHRGFYLTSGLLPCFFRCLCLFTFGKELQRHSDVRTSVTSYTFVGLHVSACLAYYLERCDQCYICLAASVL